MTRLSVCGLGVSCNEMNDTPMLLVVVLHHVLSIKWKKNCYYSLFNNFQTYKHISNKLPVRPFSKLCTKLYPSISEPIAMLKNTTFVTYLFLAMEAAILESITIGNLSVIFLYFKYFIKPIVYLSYVIFTI